MTSTMMIKSMPAQFLMNLTVDKRTPSNVIQEVDHSSV